MKTLLLHSGKNFHWPSKIPLSRLSFFRPIFHRKQTFTQIFSKLSKQATLHRLDSCLLSQNFKKNENIPWKRSRMSVSFWSVQKAISYHFIRTLTEKSEEKIKKSWSKTKFIDIKKGNLFKNPPIFNKINPLDTWTGQLVAYRGTFSLGQKIGRLFGDQSNYALFK